MMRKGRLRPGYAVSTWTQTTLRLALGDFPDTDRRRCGDQAVRPFALLAAGVCRRTPATRRIADDPDILAPNLLSRGQLFDDPTTPWPYLITTRCGRPHTRRSNGAFSRGARGGTPRMKTIFSRVREGIPLARKPSGAKKCPTAGAFGFARGPAPLVDHATSVPGRWRSTDTFVPW